MGNFLATSPWGTVLKVFAGTVLGAFYLWLQNGNSWQNLDIDALVGFVGAAIIVVVPLVINIVNPADTRYGIKG
jgi:hypothetical protein